MERLFKAVFLISLLTWSGVGICASVLTLQEARIISRVVDRHQYATAWNDIEDAVERINVTRTELGENITKYPPWRVDSEAKQKRRVELYDAAAREAELIAKRYRHLRNLEE